MTRGIKIDPARLGALELIYRKSQAAHRMISDQRAAAAAAVGFCEAAVRTAKRHLEGYDGWDEQRRTNLSAAVTTAERKAAESRAEMNALTAEAERLAENQRAAAATYLAAKKFLDDIAAQKAAEAAASTPSAPYRRQAFAPRPFGSRPSYDVEELTDDDTRASRGEYLSEPSVIDRAAPDLGARTADHRRVRSAQGQSITGQTPFIEPHRDALENARESLDKISEFRK